MKLTEGDKRFIEENLPAPYNTPDRFEEFIRPKVQIHDVLCTVTKASVKRLIEPLLQEHEHRFFFRIDDSQQQKSPASIIEKIRRSQEKRPRPGEPAPERYDLENFSQKMTDLARFRVVCNFTSDTEKVARVIKESQEIADVFRIQEKSTRTLRPKDRKSGDRSIKLILEHKTQSGLFLEIQVMTQLEEAWDKKDHFLVYEKRRKEPERDEENFPDFLDAKMFAMSELLYVADQYFEQLRSVEEDGMKNEGEDETA